MVTDKLVPRILEACVKRTRECLASQVEMHVGETQLVGDLVDRIDLRDVTAVIAVGGPMSFLVAFSLDRPLLDTMFRHYTSGIDVEDDEIDDYRHETIGDVVNLVMGQVTTDLEVAGAILNVSPPIVFAESRQVRRPRKARFAAARLVAPDGVIDVSVIGPRELFDQKLNVKT